MNTEEYNNSVERYADNLYRFILKNVRDEAKAQDIVQDTFEKLWIRVADVNYEKVKSYLFKAAYHTMIDAIRKDKRMVNYDEFPESGNSINGAYYPDLKEILDKALKTLPEIQRSAILLRDYEGYNYKEIGDITGLNESQVKVYIFRARKHLQGVLKKADLII